MEGIQQNCGVYILYMYLKVFKRLQKKKIRRVCYQRASEWPCPAVEDEIVQSSVFIFVLVDLETGCESLMCAFRASNSVHSLVFTAVSVGLHAHRPLSRCRVLRSRVAAAVYSEICFYPGSRFASTCISSIVLRAQASQGRGGYWSESLLISWTLADFSIIWCS